MMNLENTEITPLLIHSTPFVSDNIEHESSNEINYCVICLEPITPFSAYVFDCSHQLHFQCFHKYFQYNYDIENNFISCPVCRQQMQVSILREKWNCKKKACFMLKFLGALSVSSLSFAFMFLFINTLNNTSPY